jgi:hypothetical protein
MANFSAIQKSYKSAIPVFFYHPLHQEAMEFVIDVPYEILEVPALNSKQGETIFGYALNGIWTTNKAKANSLTFINRESYHPFRF